jgi:hypothetical protein
MLLLLTRDASPVNLRLDYVRGPGAEACAGPDTLEAAVTTRLGRNPFDAAAAAVARVYVEQEDDALVARVEISDEQGQPLGERVLHGRRPDCQDLMPAVSLALGLALEQFAQARPPTESPPPAPKPAARRSTPRLASPPAAVPGPRPWGFSPLLGAQVDLGRSLAVTWGPVAGVEFRVGAFSVQLQGRVDAPALRLLPGHLALGQLVVANGAGCYRLGWLGGCVVMEGGVLAAAVRPWTKVAFSPVVAAGGRMFLEVPLAFHLAARLQGDVTAPLAFSRLVVNGAPQWSSPWLQAGATWALVAPF